MSATLETLSDDAKFWNNTVLNKKRKDDELVSFQNEKNTSPFFPFTFKNCYFLIPYFLLILEKTKNKATKNEANEIIITYTKEVRTV